MSNDTPQSDESAELRHRAEKRLTRLATEVAGPGSAAQTQRLVHELQVHQIELEMQNEELRESRAQVEAALERYTDLYDFAPVGYFTLSADGAIREVNLPGARLVGHERALLVGRRLRQFVSQDTRPIFDSWLNEIFATQAKQVCAVDLVREGLPPLAVEIEAALSVDGKEGRAVVVDVTARKDLEEKLRQVQKMEVVGQLAGGVAHDFNNILAAMILKLEIWQMQHQLSAETRSSLNDLEELAKRAASLTRQLLLFSRQHAMHPEKLEINAALTNLCRMLERLLGQNITCVQLPGTGELWVEADAAMLNQAVMNLCLNAKDAMPNGGTLTMESSLTEFTTESAQIQPEARPGQFVCLRISDTGCGMDEDVLEHLFEPFFTTKEVGQGPGMGLASAYGIVHQHKGWMNVQSVVGHGTTFRLYFPLSVKKEAAPAPTGTGQLPAFKGKNEMILLVEDEATLLLLSSRALTLLGYRVLSAGNGQEALKLWEEHRDAIDLVLTDMRMPKGISGLELAEKLWKSKPSLKVVIMSGYNMELAQSSAPSPANYTFLAKPFELKTLAKTVRLCLD
jgi:PAS domain S-box-containing protein